MSVDCPDNPQLDSQLNQAYKDKFQVVLALPSVLKKRGLNESILRADYLEMGVFGTIVPAINVPAIETRFGGQSVNVSSYSRPNYPPLRLDFLIDGGFKNYYILWEWLNVLNTALESKYGGTPLKQQDYKHRLEDGILSEYQTNISILALDQYNNKIIEFIYHHAFITNLAGIEYSYRDQEVIQSSAEFAFDQLEMKYLL